MTERQHDLIVAAISAAVIFTLTVVTSAALRLPHIWPGAVIGLEANFFTVFWLMPCLRRWEARRRNR